MGNRSNENKKHPAIKVGCLVSGFSNTGKLWNKEQLILVEEICRGELDRKKKKCYKRW